MKLLFIFTLFINSIHANNTSLQNKPSMRCSISPDIVDEPSYWGFVYMEYYKNLSLNNLPNESWECIECNHNYMISNYGRMMSLKRIGGNRVYDARILKQKVSKCGYMNIVIRDTLQVKRYYTIHRLVAIAFIENKQGKKTVNHIDSNKKHNHVSNLEWSTQKEQIRHSLLNNNAGCATIKIQDVNFIRTSAANKTHTTKELSLKYNITDEAIRDIVNCNTWRFVDATILINEVKKYPV